MLNELFGKFDQIAKVSLPRGRAAPHLSWGARQEPLPWGPRRPVPSAVQGWVLEAWAEL